MDSDPNDFDVDAWNERLRLPDPAVGSTTTAYVAQEGFPVFAHSQWTMEGEIERFGAFGRGAARATGWKRVAVALVVLLVSPGIVAAVGHLAEMFGSTTTVGQFTAGGDCEAAW